MTKEKLISGAPWSYEEDTLDASPFRFYIIDRFGDRWIDAPFTENGAEQNIARLNYNAAMAVMTQGTKAEGLS
jgi:hypothetical protein